MKNIKVFVLFFFLGGEIHSFIHQYIALLASATNCSYIHPHPRLPPLSNPSFFFFFPKEYPLSLVETFLVRSDWLSEEEEQYNIFLSEGERERLLSQSTPQSQGRYEEMRFSIQCTFFIPLGPCPF